MTDSPTIALGGGGTGGHIIPALEIRRALLNVHPDIKFIYIGASGSMEQTLSDRENIPFFEVKTSALKRSLSLSNLLFPFIAIYGILQAKSILKKNDVKMVVGTGGFSSWPACAAARSLKIPYVLQEQNAWPGLTTRKLAPAAKKIFLGFKAAAGHLKVQSNRVRFSGNPLQIAGEKLKKSEARARMGLDPDRKTILVTGGSGGALSINRTVDVIKQKLIEAGYNLIWQTGKHWNGALEVPESLKKRLYIERFLYREQMSWAYQSADLAVTRCGAITLAELAHYGIPAILIPFPYSAGGHQEANARNVAELGAAVMVMDNQLNSEKLKSLILQINTENKLGAMSTAMSSLAKPDAAETIAGEILKLLDAA